MASATQKNRTVQQIPMPPEVDQAIKTLVANGTHETMAELYDHAITWFWKSRAKKTFNFYLASNKRGKYKTLWIDSKILDRVRVIAARDDTSISRVIYTAIVLYLEDKGLF